MLDRDDVIRTELNKQKHRLNYIRTTVARKGYCNFPPRRIFIEPTNVCNLNCVHCIQDGAMTRPKGFMELDVFRKIMEDIKDLNRCTELCLFQQGEPTLHKNIAEIVRLASSEYDFFTVMNTNGVTLSRELSEELLRNRLDYLTFSMDAATPETYRAIKRKPFFDKTLNNLLDFLEVWGDLETDFVRTYFAADVNLIEEDLNRAEIGLFEEMFKKLPLGHVNISQLHNFTGPVPEANARFTDSMRDTGPQSPCCNTPWDTVGVRWNGDVVPCIYDYNNRYVIGNVKDQSLQEIWNSKAMIHFRESIARRDFKAVEVEGPMCSTCSLRWNEDYALPEDYYKELSRMKKYLDMAVDRVADRWVRTEEIMKKHAYLKQNREQWLRELHEKGKRIHNG